MKTIAFLFSAVLIFLLAFWVSAPKAPSQGGSRPGEIVLVPSAGAAGRPSPTAPVRLVAAAPHSALARAIDANNVCETANLLGRLDVTAPREAASLLSAIGAPPALQELFAENGPLSAPAETPLDRFHHPLTRLTFALRLGNIYPGAPGTKGDLKRAREHLLALEKEDPSNAAYPFFLLDVEKQLGASPAALRAIAARAAAGSRFDTFVNEAQRSIQGHRFLNASNYVAIESLIQNLDTANLYGASRALQELDRTGSTAFGAKVGALMQAPGETARRGTFFYDFSGREFDAGRELRGNRGPDAAALSLEKEGLPKGFTYPTGGWLEEDGSCDEARFEADFAELRNFV
jgi:hypothetical protein